MMVRAYALSSSGSATVGARSEQLRLRAFCGDQRHGCCARRLIYRAPLGAASNALLLEVISALAFLLASSRREEDARRAIRRATRPARISALRYPPRQSCARLRGQATLFIDRAQISARHQRARRSTLSARADRPCFPFAHFRIGDGGDGVDGGDIQEIRCNDIRKYVLLLYIGITYYIRFSNREVAATNIVIILNSEKLLLHNIYFYRL